MGVHEHVSRSQVGSAHVVQFFDSDETCRESVAAFLAEGYRNGSPLILIARPVNSASILDRLEKAGVAIHRNVTAGRILVLDAANTLRRLSRNESPDSALFDDVIGDAVGRLARHGRIYAYGEMVDILAQRGDFDDAIMLENLWNDLLSRVEASLMCGYGAAHFVSRGGRDALRDICGTHSSVRVETQDMLAAWLVEQAQ